MELVKTSLVDHQIIIREINCCAVNGVHLKGKTTAALCGFQHAVKGVFL